MGAHTAHSSLGMIFDASGRYTKTSRVRYDTRDSVYVREVTDFGRYRIRASTIALIREPNVIDLLEFEKPETIRDRLELMSATIILRRE
ncbi:MAG: hypothetical protein ACREMA_09350 [Longimicrobiales bacterium]